jgi:hypothetical protein
MLTIGTGPSGVQVLERPQGSSASRGYCCTAAGDSTGARQCPAGVVPGMQYRQACNSEPHWSRLALNIACW